MLELEDENRRLKQSVADRATASAAARPLVASAAPAKPDSATRPEGLGSLQWMPLDGQDSDNTDTPTPHRASPQFESPCVTGDRLEHSSSFSFGTASTRVALLVSDLQVVECVDLFHVDSLFRVEFSSLLPSLF